MNRRRFIALGSCLLPAVAGCSAPLPIEWDDSDDDTTDDNTSDDNTTDDNGGDDRTIHEDYAQTEVRVISADGTERGVVTAAIADTYSLRYTGLSETESLPEDRGMLFVFNSVGTHEFVMREMDFGIDIVFADADGTITTIHHADAPGPDEDGSNQSYPGTGQYVLEVNQHWTTDRNITEGDILDFDLPE